MWQLANAATMLGQHLRRYPRIVATLGHCPVVWLD